MRIAHRLPTRVSIACCCLLAVFSSSLLQAQNATPVVPAGSERAFADLFLASSGIDAAPLAPVPAPSPTPAATRSDSTEVVTPATGPSRSTFASLYAGLIATQALDVHSTLRALDAGHAEANPVARWATGNPATFIAFKAGATAGMMYFTERLRKKHPTRAMILLAAIDTAYAFVVAHNYRAPVAGR
jgi:hypothetical protein